MGLRSYQLVLAAAAQRLSNVYGGKSAGNVIHAPDDIPYRQIHLQAEGADVFVGADNLTTATVYGTKVELTGDVVIVFGGTDAGPIKLSDFWVAGAGATVHVTGIPF